MAELPPAPPPPLGGAVPPPPTPGPSVGAPGPAGPSWGGPPSGSWQRPPELTGPAPGVFFGDPAARLVAYIVDAIIVSLVVLVVAIVGAAVALSGLATGSDSGLIASAIGGVFIIVVGSLAFSLAYFPWFWAHGGATPGMSLLGLRVVRDADGGPISGSQAILRLVGYWVSGFVFYLGYIWILIDKRRRGWHDLIAGTVVIRTR